MVNSQFCLLEGKGTENTGSPSLYTTEASEIQKKMFLINETWEKCNGEKFEDNGQKEKEQTTIYRTLHRKPMIEQQ